MLSPRVLPILKAEDQVKQKTKKHHFEQGPSHKKAPWDFLGKDPGANSSVFLIQEVSYF